MTRRSRGMLVVMAWLLATPPAWAGRLVIHEKADSEDYSEKIVGMVGRGLLNLSTGFVDVLVRTIEESKTGAPVLGTARGLVEGVGCGLLRMASGAADLLTCWVPGFHGVPVSTSYANCLDLQAD